MSPDRPFAGRRLSRAERRAAEARAAKRASARAVALPPPDPATRVSNPLGPRPFTPRADPPAPATSATPAAASSPVARRPVDIGPAGLLTGPVPAAERAARPAAQRPPRPQTSRQEQQREAGVPRRPLRERLLADIADRNGQVAFTVGVLAAPAGLVTAGVASGAGSLHPFDGRLLAGGIVAALLGALLGWRGRQAVRAWPRRGATVLVTLAVVAFGVGVAATPVVVGGRVQLSTSTTARAYDLAMQMRTDLYRISALDRLAAYGQEDARVHVDEYPGAIAELQSMNARYAGAQGGVVSPQFADAIGHLRTAAYWESKALDSKSQLVTQTDDKLTADVASYRNTAWTESLIAANTLEAAAQKFHFTVTADQTGPHE